MGIGPPDGAGAFSGQWMEAAMADLEEPDAGFCVAVHEMAHKLDALDGEMDGTPPLPRTNSSGRPATVRVTKSPGVGISVSWPTYSHRRP